MRSTAWLLLVPLALLAGCDSCNEKSNPPATTVGSAAPPASAPAAPDASLAPSGKMAHCPNAVTGAKTSIKDVDRGVELTVTGGDAQGTADIRARIQALVDAQKNANPNVKHTGNGEGGGLLGRCPIVLKDTAIATTDVTGGSKVTITAKDPQEVDWLRRETRDRQEDLEAAGSPAGAGKMAHCPSAIEGTTTALKNTPAGVSVVITGKDDSTTKAIRERVKHLLEIALTEDGGAGGTHTGEGGGGGSIGRCPVVLKDTTLTAKDVTGGSQVDVKAKAAADVPKLQAEAKERAAKFQLPGGAPSGSAAPKPSAAPSK